MTWVLVVTWLTASAGGGINITTWPTLAECFATGKRAQSMFIDVDNRSLANFSCMPSDGNINPTCGIDDKEACK